jgi:membrane associated rhomboid family serine protease
MRTILKTLIFTTIGISLLGAFVPQIQILLALSWSGISHFFLWQLITHVFVEPGPISLGFFLQLGFNMYILWMFGSILIERAHTRHFLTLYLGAALLTGLTALAFPHPLLAGSTNAVYAILVAWMMLNPNSQLLLFFALPFKAHWLIIGLVGFTLFLDLSAANWLGSATLAVSVLYSYLFSLIVWREQSPFPALYPFERKALRLLERKKKHQPYQHTKIYDIKSGNPVLDDDQFMDAMLDQISRHGEGSLSAAEQKRMKSISERKKK